MRLRSELGRIDDQLRALLSSMDRLQGLLDAVVAISREGELPAVLHRIVTTAMDLVGARYGALGVLDESGERLEQFIAAGLSERERSSLAGAAPCAPAVSIFAVIAGGERSGPFAGQDLLTKMINLQAFNGAAALTALLLSAVVSERNQAQREIARACGQLATMAARIAVGDRLPRLSDAERGNGADAPDARQARQRPRQQTRQRSSPHR
ncbi:hypothetical protein ACQPXS_39320 [Streptomyces sp. CA-142005]|uniref:hypothetical protein n=1 Tax=Streptomyces sp. CA-142005 TaxID=3240052 RepID=UPI003D8DC7CA